MLQQLVEKVKQIIRSQDKLNWEHYLLILGKYNPISNTIYSLNNSSILNYINDNGKLKLVEENDPRYSTFVQLKQNGYKLKPGAHGRNVYFFINKGIFNLTNKHPLFDKIKHQLNDEEIKTIEHGGYIKRTCKVNKVFNVFNYQDVINAPRLINDFNHQEIESLMQKCNVKIIHSIINKASYNNKDHFIVMPIKTQFRNKESYYATMLHEFAHWTSKNLLRDVSQYFTNIHARAKEELIAELSAASLSNFFKVSYKITQHENYLASWGKLLNDEDFFSCIIEAEKIVNYVNSVLSLNNKPLA